MSENYSLPRKNNKWLLLMVIFGFGVISMSALVQNNNPELLNQVFAKQEAQKKEPTLDELKQNRDGLVSKKDEQEKMKAQIEGELNKVNKNIEIMDGQVQEANKKLEEAIK